MSTRNKKAPNKTPHIVLRGRAEKALKQRVIDYCQKNDRSEGFLVRKAVEEFLDRNFPAPAKAA